LCANSGVTHVLSKDRSKRRAWRYQRGSQNP